MKIVKHFSTAALASVCLSLNVVHAASTPIIVGMSKSINAKDFMPMVITHDAKTGEWRQHANFNNLPDSLNLMTTNIACEGNRCFMPGKIQYQGNAFNSPITLYSEDAGNTWSANTTFNHLPTNMRNPWQIYTPGCFDGACFITSGYLSKQGIQPLLVRSTDTGKTWDVIDITSLYQADHGSINGATCHDKTCVLTGFSEMENGASRILILRSEDNGVTWKNDVAIKGLTNHHDQQYNYIAYYNHQYFITGSYSQGKLALPYILRSDDKGKTWQNIAKNIEGLPSNTTTFSMSSISCANGSCMITGNYRDKNEKGGSFILVSQDGNAWRFTNPLPFLPNMLSLNIYGITYNNAAWLLHGLAFDYSFSTRPVLMASYDHGNTWNNITLPTPHDDFSAGDVFDVQCKATTCYATGTLTTSTNLQEQGVLYQSQDSGKTWSLVPVNWPFDTLERRFTFLTDGAH